MVSEMQDPAVIHFKSLAQDAVLYGKCGEQPYCFKYQLHDKYLTATASISKNTGYVQYQRRTSLQVLS